MTFDQIQELCIRLNASPWQQRVLHEELVDYPWHTGTPTEDGWYQCFTSDKDIPYQSMKFKEGWWWDYLNMEEEKVSPEYVIAWQKIELYKGEK